MREELGGWFAIVVAMLACVVGFVLMPLVRCLAWLMRDT